MAGTRPPVAEMPDPLDFWKGYMSNPLSDFGLPDTLQRSPVPAASRPVAHHGGRPSSSGFPGQGGSVDDNRPAATFQPHYTPLQLPQLRDKGSFTESRLPGAVAGPSHQPGVGTTSISSPSVPKTGHTDVLARQRKHDTAGQSKVASKGTARAASVPENDDDMDMANLPLVVSDLDPKYKRRGTPKEEVDTAPTQARNTTPPRPLMVEIPISAEKTKQLSATPRGTTTVSVSIPSLSPGGVQKTPKTALSADVLGFRSGGESIIRGRPKGWKSGMSYREAALRNLGVNIDDPHAELLLAPRRKKKMGKKSGQQQQQRLRRRAAGSQAPNYVLKQTGRPPAPTTEMVQRNIFLGDMAVFRPFVCEWTGCRAELHNLATLRKHVRVVHGREPACRWRRCAEKTPPAVFKPAIPRKSESESENDTGAESFEEHMEYHHLVPMAWHRGDGFANSGDTGPAEPGFQVMPPPALTGKGGAKAESPAPVVAAKLPQYLLDEEGNQVTPLMQDPQLRSTALARSRTEVMRQLNDMYQQLQRRGDF